MEILKKFWSVWKRIGQVIGDLVGRVVLTVFYFTLFTPFGLGTRFLGDPLSIHPRSGPCWLGRQSHEPSMDDARRLF